MRGKSDNLEAFAKRIETRIRASMEGSDAMERLICRHLTDSQNPAISAKLAEKWVEWRYGKSKEHIKIDQSIKVEMSISDADRIITEYFSAAGSRAFEIGAGNTDEAEEQDHKLLPS